MDRYDPPFDWIAFPAGRARFSGEVRGVDELGHETIAAEIGGNEYFGEIERAFLANGNDYNIEVVAFGYGSRRYAGMPMLGTCEIFTMAEIATAQALIAQLIAAGARLDDRPSLLVEYPDARFMGEVLFRDGWVLAKDEGDAS